MFRELLKIYAAWLEAYGQVLVGFAEALTLNLKPAQRCPNPLLSSPLELLDGGPEILRALRNCTFQCPSQSPLPEHVARLKKVHLPLQEEVGVSAVEYHRTKQVRRLLH